MFARGSTPVLRGPLAHCRDGRLGQRLSQLDRAGVHPLRRCNDGSFVFGTGIFGRPRLWPYTLVRVVSFGSMLVVGSNLQTSRTEESSSLGALHSSRRFTRRVFGSWRMGLS